MISRITQFVIYSSNGRDKIFQIKTYIHCVCLGIESIFIASESYGKPLCLHVRMSNSVLVTSLKYMFTRNPFGKFVGMGGVVLFV